MNSRVFGLQSAVLVLALVAACKEDPTASQAGTPSRLDLEFAYREVIIGDSVRTFVQLHDALGNPLPTTATVTSCNTSVATIVPTSDAPQLRTAFYIKAIRYGRACVIATDGALKDTVQVATFPGSIRILGADTLVSGAAFAYNYNYINAKNQVIQSGSPPTGDTIPLPIWKTDNSARLTVDTLTGAATVFDPGAATLTSTGPGSPTDGVVGSKVVFVDAGAFTGAVTPAVAAPGDTVKFAITPGARKLNVGSSLAVAFDFVRLRTFVVQQTGDSVKAIVPGIGFDTTISAVIVRRDSSNVAQKINFRASTKLFADKYDATNDNPATAPQILMSSIAPGATRDFFVITSGQCAKGAPFPGTTGDCDDWFRLVNDVGSAVTDTIQLAWFAAVADNDLLIYDAAGTTVQRADTSGARGGNNGTQRTSGGFPLERINGFVATAGTTYAIRINSYEAGGAPSVILRLRIKRV